MNTAPIPEHFRKDGFDYHLLTHGFARSTKEMPWIIAIYRQDKDTIPMGYEVVRCRWRPASTSPQGVEYVAGFKLPNNERWGTDGWTYMTISKAYEKYHKLIGESNGLPKKKQTGAMEGAQRNGAVADETVP